MRAIRVVAFSLVAALSTAPLARAQINGRLTDEGGAVLPGVAVTAESPLLPEGRRTVFTDADGDYVFDGLPSGSYTLTLSMPGARSTTVEVDLLAGEEQTLNVVLPRGDLDIPLPPIPIPPVVTYHHRLVPVEAGIIQLCRPLPDDMVGPCEPVVAEPRPAR